MDVEDKHKEASSAHPQFLKAGDGERDSKMKIPLAIKLLGGGLALGVTFAVPFLIVPWLPRRVFGALPYYPTSLRRVKTLLAKSQSFLGKPTSSLNFIDLGSGDGVAVIAAAQEGMRAVGVELNPSLVVMSWVRALLSGVNPALRPFRSSLTGSAAYPFGYASFTMRNLFSLSVAEFDIIMMFGVGPLMPRLSKKLLDEAKDDAIVVLHKFELPDWTPIHQDDDLTFYRVRDNAALRPSRRNDLE